MNIQFRITGEVYFVTDTVVVPIAIVRVDFTTTVSYNSVLASNGCWHNQMLFFC